MSGADQLRLDVAVEPPPDLTGDDDQVLYFGSRRQSGTWIVSGFVVVHLIVFFATMAVNNCPVRSAGDCALPFLGRFSFQLLSENPLIGPSSSTLVKMGAMERKFTIQQHQSWCLLTYLWLHTGVVHLVVNLLSTFFVGIYLEQDFGPFWLLQSLSSISQLLDLQVLFLDYSVPHLLDWFGIGGAGSSFCNQLSLGLLPHVDYYSNIGGFAYLLFTVILVGGLLAVIRGVDANACCS